MHGRGEKIIDEFGAMGSGWILGKLVVRCGLDSTGSGLGLVASCCECGDELSGSCATKFLVITFQ
jgi:hypothetical protein